MMVDRVWAGRDGDKTLGDIASFLSKLVQRATEAADGANRADKVALLSLMVVALNGLLERYELDRALRVRVQTTLTNDVKNIEATAESVDALYHKALTLTARLSSVVADLRAV
jgi:hypothetical protein